MRIIKSIAQMQRSALSLKRSGKTIGLVPTMGALHEGHLSLIRKARAENKIVIVSIFVNPIQFSPNEDFQRYPRPFKQDSSLCRQENVDYIFFPSARQMYPEGFKSYVEVRELGDGLCGAMRPGHFRGVTTVVSKLFNITQPDRAYFGQKDAQQAAIIDRMTKDLDFPCAVRILPVVRESDGLAMSSRNRYLSVKERGQATVLSAALRRARQLVNQGVRSPEVITSGIASAIKNAKSARIEYIKIVDARTLKPVERIRGKALIALAVRFGKTRLIDNIIVQGRAG
jgi:pantoate--beta-alanine ligase